MKINAKIFIAGAAGMVGSALIRKLLAMGYTNLIGSYHSRKPDIRSLLLSDGKTLPAELSLEQIDLTRQAEVDQFFKTQKPDHVFLAAAKVGGIHANNSYPADFIHQNLSIQTNVIHSAYETGVERLLFLGSSCIYPKMASQPMKEEYLLTGTLEPTNEPYAIAKIAGIKMCEAYNRQYGARFMAVMPTNLYGPNDNFDLNNSHVLPALIRKFHLAKLAAMGNWKAIAKDEARFGPIPNDIKISLGLVQPSSLSHQPPVLSSQSSELGAHSSTLSPHSSALSTQHSVVIWGTGSARREFLHVDDMADASIFVMNLNDDILSKEFLNYPRPCFVNIGTGIDSTIKELAEQVRALVGFNGPIRFDSSKPDGMPRKLLNVSRIQRVGWRASIDLVEGIKRTYRWYLKQ